MDYGSRYADKREKILALRFQKIYLEAQKNLEEQFEAFLNLHRIKGTEMWQKLRDRDITQKEYSSWMRSQVLTGKEWQRRIDSATEMLAIANEKALSMVRGEQMNVFAENANYESYQIEKDFRGAVSFDIYDNATVDMLVNKKPELLPPPLYDAVQLVPEKKLIRKKDRAWNQGVIANAVTQAIVQGESIPKLAMRLARDTANTNMKAMVRYARTAMTGAQNAGRIETMHRAQDMGINVRKQWLATLDRRTRDSHRQLDGQEQDVDKPFKSGYGDIMFPGDPAAAPGDVYNCRCTLLHIYPKHEKEWWQGERRDQETGETIEHMSYREWIAAKEKERYGHVAKRTEVDVTEKYFKNAKPRAGKVTYDKILDETKHTEEIKMARWLRDTFGGDVHVRQEIDVTEGIKYCDFIWKGRNWELKSPDEFKSPDGILGTALKQIRKSPGGIILDYQCDEFDLNRLINGAKRRMTTAGFNVDLMILHKGRLMCIKRYKK